MIREGKLNKHFIITVSFKPRTKRSNPTEGKFRSFFLHTNHKSLLNKWLCSLIQCSQVFNNIPSKLAPSANSWHHILLFSSHRAYCLETEDNWKEDNVTLMTKSYSPQWSCPIRCRAEVFSLRRHALPSHQYHSHILTNKDIG